MRKDIIKVLLGNLLFFIPKRKVTVEFLTNPPDFPRYKSRHEINRYLEKYHNKDWGPAGEPLNKVSDYFWKNSSILHEARLTESHFDIDSVDEKIKQEVIQLIADRAKKDPSLIDVKMNLKNDLGFDSLEITDILLTLEKKFKVNQLVPDQVLNVGSLIARIVNAPVEQKIIRSAFTEINKTD